MPTGTTTGKYRLIAELGRGGMAEVYLAVAGGTSLSFSKLVVIKKLREHLANDMDFVTMLVDEARIAARLNHPNLVQTIEMGEEDGEYYLTMEYLDGQPLHRLISRAKGRVPLNVHLTILSDVLRGIDYAHNLKDYDGSPLDIVHRDVTPHNVFVTYEGQTKVVDFGIAKAAGRVSETRYGVVKGKTAYMAPEQALGRHVDRRVDVFAVGVMIYEAAIQSRMWKGIDETNIVRRLVAGQIPSSPKAMVPTIDDELDAICRRALAARAEERYPTAAALQAELDAFLGKIGRASNVDVANVMTTVFAETRASTNAIIEKQLAALKDVQQRSSLDDMIRKAASGSHNRGKLLDAHSMASTSMSSATEAGTPPAGAPAPASPPPVVVPAPPRPPEAQTAARLDFVSLIKANPLSFLPLLVATVALATATTLATVTAVTMLSKRDAAAQKPPPAAKKMVTVTLRAAPLETRFAVDDGPPLENPFIGTFEADDKPHYVRASAPGFLTQVVKTTFEKDLSLRLSLAAERAAPAASTSSVTTPKKK